MEPAEAIAAFGRAFALTLSALAAGAIEEAQRAYHAEAAKASGGEIGGNP
jgi:hypothetical protein